jgi:hypothetical protein
MPISAGTMLALSAISSLAQAGGMGLAGMAQGEAAEEQAKLAKKKMLLDEQNRMEDLRRDDARYSESRTNARRAELNAAPANSISMLSGISNLRNGMSHSNGLDVLSLLSGMR